MTIKCEPVKIRKPEPESVERRFFFQVVPDLKDGVDSSLFQRNSRFWNEEPLRNNCREISGIIIATFWQYACFVENGKEKAEKNGPGFKF